MSACKKRVAEIKYIPKNAFPIDPKQTTYSSGPNNGVVLNKFEGGIFLLFFVKKEACGHAY